MQFCSGSRFEQLGGLVSQLYRIHSTWGYAGIFDWTSDLQITQLSCLGHNG